MLSWILVIHFIADFVGQTDKMAVNKSKSYEWLTRHVIAYTYITIIGSLIPILVIVKLSGTLYSADFVTVMFCWVLLNSILHWITDAITSRLSSKMWAAGRRHAFFVVIGADQLVHQLCLIITSTYVFDKCLNFH